MGAYYRWNDRSVLLDVGDNEESFAVGLGRKHCSSWVAIPWDWILTCWLFWINSRETYIKPEYLLSEKNIIQGWTSFN